MKKESRDMKKAYRRMKKEARRMKKEARRMKKGKIFICSRKKFLEKGKNFLGKEKIFLEKEKPALFLRRFSPAHEGIRKRKTTSLNSFGCLFATKWSPSNIASCEPGMLSAIRRV